MSDRATPFLVGITGGSGSGKTTLARHLVETFGADRVAVVAHDAYYRDRSDLDTAARGALDYDVPEALDRARFVADLARLRDGTPIRPPRYCFVTHRRLGDGAAVEPRDLDAPGGLRLRRRVARDTVERGRTPASVVHQFAATVAPAHGRYVEPTKALADLVLSTTSRIEPLVEVAATLIRARLDRRRDASTTGAMSAVQRH
jgi:uridine kinase